MLSQFDAVANLAVKDLAAAERLYAETLGFTAVLRQDGELIKFQSGSTVFNVYRSDFAGTNQATAVSWSVGDQLAAIVAALAAKGVTFEEYDMPGMVRAGAIHGAAGEMQVAWFKDPDGNILNLTSV